MSKEKYVQMLLKTFNKYLVWSVSQVLTLALCDFECDTPDLECLTKGRNGSNHRTCLGGSVLQVTLPKYYLASTPFE